MCLMHPYGSLGVPQTPKLVVTHLEIEVCTSIQNHKICVKSCMFAPILLWGLWTFSSKLVKCGAPLSRKEGAAIAAELLLALPLLESHLRPCLRKNINSVAFYLSKSRSMIVTLDFWVVKFGADRKIKKFWIVFDQIL